MQFELLSLCFLALFVYSFVRLLLTLMLKFFFKLLLLFCFDISALYSSAKLKGKFSLESQNTSEPVSTENRKAEAQLNIALNVMGSLTKSTLKTPTFKQQYHQYKVREFSDWKK